MVASRRQILKRAPLPAAIIPAVAAMIRLPVSLMRDSVIEVNVPRNSGVMKFRPNHHNIMVRDQCHVVPA